MYSDIRLLGLADGLKDALINSGFLTIKSVLNSTVSDISSKLGIDLYIAQIIIQEAKRLSSEMSRVYIPLDVDISTPPNVIIEKEELNPA
jgi:hypothetical protein